MKKYKVREYINKLKEDNEIESLNMCDDILDIEINYMTYNSNNVDFDTMFICKGDNFKEEYLNSAIKNGAIVYVSEKKYNVNIPGIIVKNIRNSLSLLSDMYFDFPEKYLTKIGITGTKGKTTTSFYTKYILDEYAKENLKKDTAIISSLTTYDGIENFGSHITTPESYEIHKHFRNAVDSEIKNVVMEVSSQAYTKKYGRLYGLNFDIGVFLNMSKPILWIVIPCYNEEQVLPITAPMFLEKISGLAAQGLVSEKSRVLFVNDGSKDKTWELIQSFAAQDEHYIGISQSRNRGHQNALLAGLMTARERADMVISMDADLQDDINAVDQMIEKYYEGCDIVYGVRSARDTDTFFKRFTAEAFYKLINKMGGELVYNHADYRLMSKRALKGLLEFDEVNIFLRGMVPMVGYQSDIVTYERAERFAGESKYPLKKMLSFAFEGITSLSVKPIKMIFNVGILICIISVLAIIYCLVRHFTNNTVSGWTSLVMSIWFLGGLQLIAIGMVGQYIGKIYLETKARPKFIIEQVLND